MASFQTHTQLARRAGPAPISSLLDLSIFFLHPMQQPITAGRPIVSGSALLHDLREKVQLTQVQRWASIKRFLYVSVRLASLLLLRCKTTTRHT